MSLTPESQVTVSPILPRIIYVPIEPLSERYTEQWYRKFPEAFNAHGFEVMVIDGTPLLHNEIKVGAFLDINSTVHYKMSQLQAIAKMFHNGEVRRGDIFFFGDIEFWGLESVKLMAQMNDIKVVLTGFLHAASYTKEDAFSVAADYQQFTEVGWLAALDKVFIGSVYHKQAIVERRNLPHILASKIVVTKNPLFLDEYHDFGPVKKQRKVLLTNRFDQEKRPGETINLFRSLKQSFPNWEFVVCTSRPGFRGRGEDNQILNQAVSQNLVNIKPGLTKEQYHRELAEAYMVVSHSIEENYGYCIAEAIHYGCIPILRAGMSHDEFVTPQYTFNFNHVGERHETADYKVASKWMRRFGLPTPVIPLDTSGMQNIINELLDLR